MTFAEYISNLQSLLLPFKNQQSSIINRQSPFSRLAAAIQAIGSFAENHQVLFFTCHPDHAGELQSLAGAKTLQMTT